MKKSNHQKVGTRVAKKALQDSKLVIYFAVDWDKEDFWDFQKKLDYRRNFPEVLQFLGHLQLSDSNLPESSLLHPFNPNSRKISEPNVVLFSFSFYSLIISVHVTSLLLFSGSTFSFILLMVKFLQ